MSSKLRSSSTRASTTTYGCSRRFKRGVGPAFFGGSPVFSRGSPVFFGISWGGPRVFVGKVWWFLCNMFMGRKKGLGASWLNMGYCNPKLWANYPFFWLVSSDPGAFLTSFCSASWRRNQGSRAGKRWWWGGGGGVVVFLKGNTKSCWYCR